MKSTGKFWPKSKSVSPFIVVGLDMEIKKRLIEF